MEERFRKVLGMEMEITIWAGEQVIPGHAQGVGAEGSHEEERDEEEDEDVRERRASPSGDRHCPPLILIQHKRMMKMKMMTKPSFSSSLACCHFSGVAWGKEEAS
ncbi:sister-chromatid cohesion protein 3 [Striga asiatica]|uniref:Sister-chromatid cohesion protein 3 n=1 Tax=Striga asiatica TaxID=4170 RepID=A0A5A7RCX8_STRAF|nr:sister-chromatid cohesion protein 3 [Striga asiatica]